MKKVSFKIFLITKAFKKQGVIVLFFAIFIAIFCLPNFSSWAYYKVTTCHYYDNLQHIVRTKFKTETKSIETYVTAYSSTPEQTDSSPCISASGYNLCKHNRENVVACNFLPFGTKIIIPELDPDRVYTVVDRMNSRYDNRIDIWKRSKSDARSFGLRLLTVEIIE